MLQRTNRSQRRTRIILAVTGSVAAVKGPEIAVRLVKELDYDVRILLTRGGEFFWRNAKDYNKQYWNLLQDLLLLSEEKIGIKDVEDNSLSASHLSICYADDEWKEWQKLGDPVLHIDLRDWADLLLVAPLSAHTLAKISNGLCDDTLSCVIRAWDYGHGLRPGKTLLLAPAMNTAMWGHPLTQSQLQTVQGFWNNSRQLSSTSLSSSSSLVQSSSSPLMYTDDENSNTNKSTVSIISPQVKKLACGEIGNGALASVDEILKVCLSYTKHR